METSRLIPIFVKIFYDVKIKEVVFALERFAPLPLQESYDNAGLQVGLTEVEASGALLCLDVTEEVIDEAVSLGCNLIVSHHPLLFHGLKTVSDRNYVERCVRKAIQNDVTVYAAHTNLDNAEDGVNFKIAEKLELEQVRLLLPHPVKVKDGGHEYTVMAGSGVIGVLPQPEDSLKFLQRIMHYHQYFGHDQELQIAVMGHYQSEQYTKEIFYSIIGEICPELPLYMTAVDTNPIKYL